MTRTTPAVAESATDYDRIVYSGHSFSQTHPDRLATLASLHGMSPAPPARCRVLELGCADGGNLVPMAYQCPDSEFVGVDLSERAIARAVETVAELGLGNITLSRVDILDIGADFGRFDYIIAHGFPPRLATVVGERPHASRVARRQAAQGPLVTNLRHSAVWLEDEIVRRFLVLVDGTRTIEEIVRVLGAGGGPQVTREEVEHNLAIMARLGLLIA